MQFPLLKKPYLVTWHKMEHYLNPTDVLYASEKESLENISNDRVYSKK